MTKHAKAIGSAPKNDGGSAPKNDGGSAPKNDGGSAPRNDAAPALQERAAFESQLPEGRQRFLAHVIEHGFAVGQRAPEDFIRHFPPAAIMNALESEPKLRANILVICSGTKHKVAIKKSAESCGQELQIALDEGETDAATIVALFDPDDRVRHLDAQALWRYVTEGELWATDARANPKSHERTAAHVTYILERALQDGLTDPEEIVGGITTEKITELMPRHVLHELIAGALAAARKGQSFSERDLLTLCPPALLTKHVPLALLWERVVMPKIAVRQKFVPGPVPKPPPPGNSGDEEPADRVSPRDLDIDIDAALGGLSRPGKPSPGEPRAN